MMTEEENQFSIKSMYMRQLYIKPILYIEDVNNLFLVCDQRVLLSSVFYSLLASSIFS